MPYPRWCVGGAEEAWRPLRPTRQHLLEGAAVDPAMDAKRPAGS